MIAVGCVVMAVGDTGPPPWAPRADTWALEQTRTCCPLMCTGSAPCLDTEWTTVRPMHYCSFASRRHSDKKVLPACSYKTHFRWEHYRPDPSNSLKLPIETEACPSVTAAFLKVWIPL